MVLIVPPCLLKLRAAITGNSQHSENRQWSSITSVAYAFVVFWFNYSMALGSNNGFLRRVLSNNTVWIFFFNQ